jgi:hypothetical protein
MDVLEKRIIKMAKQSLKTPRSSRQKEIERSNNLKKYGQETFQGITKDWSRPKRNISTNSYFTGRARGSRAGPRINQNSKDASQHHLDVSENRLNNSGASLSDNYNHLRKSLKLGTVGRLRQNLGQERSFTQTISNQICCPNVKDGYKFSDYQLQGRKLGEGAYAVVRPGKNL